MLRSSWIVGAFIAAVLAAAVFSPVFAGQVTLCQCNIFDGGKWTEQDQSVVTYDTARRFAEAVAAINPPGSAYPPITVIGMEELISETDRTTIEGLLEQKTGAAWDSIRIPVGVNGGSGVGFFWRPDTIESFPNWNLGGKTVERLDNGYDVKFAGRLFRKIGTDEAFGLFAGKLTWGGAILNGHEITEEERRQEAVTLLDWIRNGEPANPANPGMSAYPGTCRMITTDLNTDTGTSTWNQMNTEFTDPSSQHTHNSFSGQTWMDLFGYRLDYVWWDYDGYDKHTGGFVNGPTRTVHFGSDHRAVYATVNIQPVDVTPPTVSLTSPVSGQTIASNIKITATATDSSGIGYVDFYVDSVKKWTDSTYPFEYNWDITGYAPGYHTVYAAATDNSSNRLVGRSMAAQVKIVVPVVCPDIAAAKTYADQTTVEMHDRVVSASFGNLFYIQDPDRTSGIRVSGTPVPEPGDVVDLAGTLTSSYGERQLNLVWLTPVTHQDPPGPLGLANRDVGGAAFNSHTPGIEGGLGVNNIGLLVTTWGRITQIDTAKMYVDDGSGVSDSSGLGVRIELSGIAGLPPLQVDQYVRITGVSTVYYVGGKCYREIRPRDSTDITAAD